MNRVDVELAVSPYIRKLAEMETSREIADFLIREDVKAVRGFANACAIAAYVRERSGVDVHVYSNAIKAQHGDGKVVSLAPGLTTTIWDLFNVATTTEAMKAFISNFDSGKYPELIG